MSDRRSNFLRRAVVCTGLVFGAVGALLAGVLVLSPTAAVSQDAAAQGDVPVAELMKPTDLTDLSIGNKDAAITIVEYASMTCSHCAHFHNTVYPELKKKYIDTGKVRFIMREFPLNNLAAAASMLARCSGDATTFPLISVLFKKQRTWAGGSGNPIEPMFEIAKQAGFTRERFDSCLKDQALLQKILKTRERAAQVFGVKSTPTFFINGKILKGGQGIEVFDKVLEPMLAEG